jgi:hypothetical protein
MQHAAATANEPGYDYKKLLTLLKVRLLKLQVKQYPRARPLSNTIDHRGPTLRVHLQTWRKNH